MTRGHTPIPDGLAVYMILTMLIDQNGNKAAKVLSHRLKKKETRAQDYGHDLAE